MPDSHQNEDLQSSVTWEGFSTARPPLFSGEDFAYWKDRMECHLKTQVEMWIVIQTGFTIPFDNDGLPLTCERWDAATRKKIEADAKATQTLQCGLTKEELNRIGPFISAKDLWNKLNELHEGTSDTKVSKRDLLLNKLYNIRMMDRESASGLHAQIQDLLNGLHAIDQKIKNHDVIRYALKAFPKNTLWASMVDAYKVSRDLC
ncbi:uncharacterized protein LOC141818016 [Curcuma longa]|uniref:uncharacterized protein LOC141818016 n=1 Tax=Curcuma longa TaxID=136217 RepID=UPI003D9ED7CF